MKRHEKIRKYSKHPKHLSSCDMFDLSWNLRMYGVFHLSYRSVIFLDFLETFLALAFSVLSLTFPPFPSLSPVVSLDLPFVSSMLPAQTESHTVSRSRPVHDGFQFPDRVISKIGTL